MKEMIKKIKEYVGEVGKYSTCKDMPLSWQLYLDSYLEDVFTTHPEMIEKAKTSLIFDERCVANVIEGNYTMLEMENKIDVVLFIGLYYAACDNYIIKEAIEYYVEQPPVDWWWLEAYIEGAVRHSYKIEAPEDEEIMMLMTLVDMWEHSLPGDFNIYNPER